MSSLHPDTRPRVVSPSTEELTTPSRDSKLWALISLYDGNPGVLGSLLQELRATSLFVARPEQKPKPGGGLTLACADVEGTPFVLSFTDRDEAQKEVAHHRPGLTIVATTGEQLLKQISRNTAPIGLCLVQNGKYAILDLDVVAAGSALADERCPIAHLQLSLTPFAQQIPKAFRTEMEIFCLQHPNISRLYLCTEQHDNGESEDVIVLVGDPAASKVNIEEILAIISYRTGVVLGPNPVTWVQAEHEPKLQEAEIDCVYSKP